MKRKFYILSIIVGIAFCLSSILGFYSLNSVEKTISGYDGSNELYKNVYDWDTHEYYDTYWDYLAHHECNGILGTCYCDFVDNEDACLNELLTKGGGSHSDVSKGLIILIKYRYISIVLAILSFISAWLFHEKKVKPTKKEQAKEN